MLLVDLIEIQMNPLTGESVLVLREHDEPNRLLPIVVGGVEAASIAFAAQGQTAPRPMTHDLIQNLLAKAGCTVDHIYIHTLDDSVFIASIQLRDSSANTHQVDSRPSDAIALALRAKVDVLVDPSVLERAVIGESSTEETLRSILEKMRPEDMGEYEM